MAIGRKNKKTVQRNWRPDFRDTQSLPDTKVIRTGFLLNFIAIALTLLVLSIFIVREYSLQNMKKNVVALEAQVAENTAHNRTLLDANKQFKQNSTIVQEVIDFDRQVLDVPKFLEGLPALIPERMLLSVLEMRPLEDPIAKNKTPAYVVIFRGRVTGSEGISPSQIITDFQGSLLKIPDIKSLNGETDLTSFTRNNEQGYFDFTLQLKIEGQAGTKS